MKPSWKKIYPPYLKDGTPISEAIVIHKENGVYVYSFHEQCTIEQLHDIFDLPLDGTPQENAAVFDKRTAKGFKLNLVTGKYEKSN